MSIIAEGSFPDPASDFCNIVYWLSKESDVTIKVFTVSGEVVVDNMKISGSKGYNSFYWDGKNRFKRIVASGVYIYRITARTADNEAASALRKMSIVR